MRANIWPETLKIKYNSQGTDEKIILVSILKKHKGSVWIGVFMDKDRIRWRASVNTTRNLLQWRVILE
jgi:hypothetical protein